MRYLNYLRRSGIRYAEYTGGMRANVFESRTGYSTDSRQYAASHCGIPQNPATHKDSREHRPGHRHHEDRWLKRIVLIGLAVVAFLWITEPAGAAQQPWQGPVSATWYGPGFYGNAFACSHRPDVPDHYATNTRGTAHMTLPCGAKVTICKRVGRWKRCVKVRVIDRGNFYAGNFDLTARTAMDLCRCHRPYTQTVTWKRGWT